MSDVQHSSTGLLITRDLFFASKVTGTAAALGLHVVSEADPRRAAQRIADVQPVCVILDLATPGLSAAELMAALPTPRPRVIAFGSHVDTIRLDEARAAGCDEVMPRSRFSARLAEILKQSLRG